MTKVKHMSVLCCTSACLSCKWSRCQFSHTPHNLISPPPPPLPTPVFCLWCLMTSFLPFITNSRRNSWKYSADCSSPYVPPGQCLSGSHEAQDFTTVAAADGGEREEPRKNRNIFQKCALLCAHKERFYLKLFRRVAAIPIIVFLLLRHSINDSNWSQTVK